MLLFARIPTVFRLRCQCQRVSNEVRNPLWESRQCQKVKASNIFSKSDVAANTLKPTRMRYPNKKGEGGHFQFWRTNAGVHLKCIAATAGWVSLRSGVMA